MPHEETRHIVLANQHEAFVLIVKDAGRITGFAIQVVRVLEDRTYQVYQADTAHGHPHDTWQRGRERIRAMRERDLTDAFAMAWRKAKEVAHADDPTKRSS